MWTFYIHWNKYTAAPPNSVCSFSVSVMARVQMSLPLLAQCIPPTYPHLPPYTPLGPPFGRGPWLETVDTNVNEVVLTLPTTSALCSGKSYCGFASSFFMELLCCFFLSSVLRFWFARLSSSVTHSLWTLFDLPLVRVGLFCSQHITKIPWQRVRVLVGWDWLEKFYNTVHPFLFLLILLRQWNPILVNHTLIKIYCAMFK